MSTHLPANSVLHHRHVRSFVRREGRITPAQQRALDELWPRYGVDAPAAPLSLPDIFGRAVPVTMEIGFGNGEHLLSRARSEPQHDFLGIEVHRPGVGRVLLGASQSGVANLRVACADAVEVLRDWLPGSCLSEIMIFFPDPWPKKRHHKRRLLQPDFAALAASRLVAGGRLRLATDWADYARHMLAVLNAEPALRNASPDGRFVPRPADRTATRFEQRGGKLGHQVFDLEFRHP